MYKFENSFLKLLAGKFLPACIVALCALAPFRAHAQLPPANDNLTNATIITGASGSVTGSNIGATDESSEPDPTAMTAQASSFSSQATVWYAWTASFSGLANFNTSGSTDPNQGGAGLDTVLAVYVSTNNTGTNFATFQEVASNDDDINGGVTSRVLFQATLGTVYYIQVGSTQPTPTFTYDTGNIVLNWAQAPSSGTFVFSKPVFIMSENEGDLLKNHGVPGSIDSSISKRGAYIAVTRKGGYVGRAEVTVTLTPDNYTNTLITNYYGTNVFTTNFFSSQGITFTNINGKFILLGPTTNFAYTNISSTNIEIRTQLEVADQNGRYNTNVQDFYINNVTATKTGVATPQGTNSQTTFTLNNSISCIFPTNFPFPSTNIGGIQVDTNTVVVVATNIFSFSTTNISITPAAAPGVDYNLNLGIPRFVVISNVLTFDDFEMVKIVPVLLNNGAPTPGLGPDFPDNSGRLMRQNVNRSVTLSLSNAKRDDHESLEISSPTNGPTARLTILSTADYPQHRGPYDTCTNYAGFNFEVKHMTTSDDTSHDAVINVMRTGDPSLALTISYMVSSRSTVGDFLDNRFDLEVGSDYATTFQDFTPVVGTLSWSANDTAQTKQIQLPIIGDTGVEFNEDIKIDLFETLDQFTSQPTAIIGYIDSCLVTIPHNAAPAGATDTGFNPDGVVSSYPPFNAVPGANKPVRALAVQPDGKTVIGGTFTAFDSVTNNRITRLLASGLPDASFNTGSGANDYVGAVALDSANRVIIGGGFTSVNGTNRYHIARLLTSGILDTNFHPQFGANGNVSAIAIQPNGQILIGGAFTTFDNTNRAYIARLNTDGTLDTTFDPGIGPDGLINAIALQSTGDIIIGGEFSNVSGSPFSKMARIHTDGSLDATFALGSGADGSVLALSVQSDDKIMMGGSFSHMNLLSRASVARLNADGSLDATFDPGMGANDAVYTVQAQSDGTIFIGGLFTSYDQTRRIGVARLLPQGMLDTSFIDTAHNQFAGLINHYYNTNYNPTAVEAPGDFPAFSNTRNAVYALATDPVSGGLMIGGSFARTGGGPNNRTEIHTRFNVARLVGGTTPGPGNIIFGQNVFSVDESAGLSGLFVTVLRTNGTLGRVTASLGLNLFPPGPGAATTSDFPANQPFTQNAAYASAWDAPFIPTPSYTSYGWQISDCLFGADYLQIKILDNTNVQPNRFAALSLFNPNGIDTFTNGGDNIPLGVALGRSSGQFEIVDDDFNAGVLGFTVTNFSIIENGGYATVTVARTNGSTGQVTVQYSTANGSALDKVDYAKTNGTLTFPDSVLTQTFQVKILDNFTAQPDRTFKVSLSSPTAGATLNSSLLSSNATVTIVDNDYGPGHLKFSAPTYSALEGAGGVTVTINRTGGNAGAISVDFITTNDPAASNPATTNLDYTPVIQHLVWNNNDSTPKTVTIPIIQDGLVEGNETFSILMTNPVVSGGFDPSLLIGSTNNTVVTIIDDDFYGTPIFLSRNFNVMENAGQAIVTVVRVNGTAGTLQVNYTTADGTATNGQDYTGNSGLLTFGPGETSKTFIVPVIDNTTRQSQNRIINLILSSPSPAVALVTNGFPLAATLTIVDDESVNNPAGSVDQSETASFNDYVHAIGLQPDGKILAGGDFTSVNSFPKSRLARLNTDGSLDNTFQLNMAGADGPVRTMLSQTPPTGFTDGSIMISGAFHKVNGVNRNGVARLNLDGSLDETFDPGSGADGPVFALKEVFLGASRKYMVAGAFANYNGTYCGGIARINESGTIDPTFNPGLGITSANAAIYALAIQPNGQIIIGGDYTSVNGVIHHHLARLNLDGSLDSSYNPDPGLAGSVRALCLQTDGKVLVGGLFTTMNGTNFNHIARLNTDGSVDASFNLGVGANDTVLSLAIDSEGKILVGGEFTTASGVTRNRLTRLNPDGTVDPTINFGLGADNFIEAIAVQTDSSILIGGGFLNFNGISTPHLARIAGGGLAGSGLIEFTAANYGVNENGTNAVITFQRTGGTGPGTNSPTVSATFLTSDGTAMAGIDYIGVTNLVSFPVGETFVSMIIPIIDNQLVDADRTVNLNLTGGSEINIIGLQPFATLTISNDDSAVSFGAIGYREAENVVGGNARISLIRLGSLIGSITVTAETTTNGTAVPGARYTPITNTFTFGPGETNKTFLVPLINDTLIEGDQSVGLQLVNPLGGFLAAPSIATLTIAEDDTGPGVLSFSATNYVVNEGSNIVITILRTNGITGPVSVNLLTRDGTATAGLDYLATNVPVNFADGEFIKTVTIQTLQDTLVEPTESIFLVLTNIGGGAIIGGTNVAELDILDDDLNFSFGAPAYFVNEGGGTVTLSIFRNSGTNGTASVDYMTTNAVVTNGIATAGLDYTPTSGTLTFAPGEIFKTITIPILQDTLVEGAEIFQVLLQNPSAGAQIGAPGVAAVTIVDDDAAFTFASITNVVSEGGTNAIITVNRINVNTGPVSVHFATADGTATANVDYIPTNGILNFVDGQSAATFSIPIIDDTLVEGDETVNLILSNPSTNAVLLVTNAILTIVDNDMGFQFTSTDYRISESGVSASISVSRLGATNLTASVNFATSDGTATAGSDYVFTNGTISFLPGETVKTFNVSIIDDTIIEGDETVLLSLSSPSTNAVLLSPNTATLTIVDNDGSLVVSAGTALLSESFSPANNTIDPGETVSLYFAFRSIGGGNTANLVATLQATNGITSPSGPQSYGVVVQNGPSVSRPFTFTAGGTNGQGITAVFKLWDVAGASSNFLGVATFNFNLGSVTTAFSNLNAIVINDSAAPPTKASPYPAIINVSGVVGTLTQVRVSFSNYAHQFPDDVGVLLVGPANQKALLMTDAGGGTSVTNVNLTFDDSASAFLPDTNQVFSGTYKPSNYKTNFLIGSVFPSVGPPAATSLSVFNGTNPNGAWSLYVIDDAASDSGSINNGWSLKLITGSPVNPFADLVVGMTVSPAQATVSNLLTYTVAVTNYGPSGATNIVLTDVLPAGVTYVSNTLNGTPDTNGILVSTIASLPKDAGLTYNIVVIPNNIATITNVITGTLDQTDPNLTNNTVAIVSNVAADSANLGVTIGSSANPILAASTVTYTIVATNYGPSVANAAVVTNSLPSGLSLLGATTTLGTIATNGSSVVFSLGNFSAVAGQNVATMTVTARATAAGTNNVPVNIASLIFDPFKANNTNSVKTEVDLPVLTYTNAPNGFVLNWPGNASAYALQGTTNLHFPIGWVTLTSPAPTFSGGIYSYFVTNAKTNNVNYHFFRLAAPLP